MSEVADHTKQLEYLYSLDEEDFLNRENLLIARELAKSDNDDIKEISIMRLGCRAKDIEIYNLCLEILNDELMFNPYKSTSL